MPDPKWAPEGKLVGELIDARGFERPEFARLLGVSDDVLSNICRGVTRLRGTRRTLAASLLKMDEATLREKLADASAPPPRRPSVEDARPDRGPLSTVNVRGKLVIVPQGMMAVPIYSSIPASRPGRTFSQARDVEFVPDYEGDLPMWGVFVFGDSMEPEFLNGDIVIFEERQALPMQAVYAEKDGEETFKLLRPTKVGFEFWPLNDAHEPFSAEGWTIRGVLRRRVRYLQGGLKNTLDYPYTYTFRLPKA